MHARGAIVMVLAGCGRIGFDPSIAVNGDGNSDGRSSCTWGGPTKISELGVTTENSLSPSLSIDELTIFFQSDRTGMGDIYVAQRSTPTGTFGTPQELTVLDSTAHDRDPALAGGGTHLYYTSDRVVQSQDFLYLAIGSATSFGAPTVVAELGNPVLGPWVADNELEMFYTDDSGHVFRTTRADTSSMWGASTQLVELGQAGYPSLTGDAMTIYFETSRNGRGEIYMATRTAPGAAFSAALPIPEVNAPFFGVGDPWVSADGNTLYFDGETASGAGFYVYQSRRVCI